MSFAVLSDIRQVEAIVGEWWELWRRCPNATPFQSPAWLLPWWRAFHPGQLRVVAVRRGRLVALAPLYLEESPEGRRLLPIGISISDFLDVLIDPESDAGAELVGAVSAAEDWRRWEMEEAEGMASVLTLLPPEGIYEETTEQSLITTLFLNPDQDVTELQSPSTRRHIRLARNRAARQGEFRIRQIASGEIDAFLTDLARLHGERWRAKGEAGVFADRRVQAFHREAAPALHAEGLGRFLLATMDGQAVAALYLLVRDGRHMAYLTGFDGAHSFFSPGALLLTEAIQTALREGAREFSFLRGEEAYKQSWLVEQRLNLRRSFVRPARG